MKRKIAKKSIVVLIIVSLLVPVVGFAEEGKKVTFEELFERGIKINPSVKNAEHNIESVEITRDRANTTLNYIPNSQFFASPEPIMQFKQVRSLDRTLKNAKDKLQIEIDSTRFEIMKKYQSVINAKNNSKNSAEEMEYKKKLMDISVLKKNMGLVSEVENNSAIQGYNIAKRDFALKKEELNKAYADLNSLVGFEKGYRYNLEQNTFANIDKELKDSDLEYLNTLGRDSLMIDILERGLEQTQFSYDFYVFNDPTEPRPSDAIYEEIQAEKSNIAATKDNLSESIRTLFFNAQDTQKKYKDLLAKNEIDEKLHEVKKIQFDLGMITKIDLMESEKTLLENETNLIALRNGFNEIIYMLNYPHVASR